MTSPLKLGAPLLPPLLGAMPGRIFRSSAALRPTMAMFWICSPVIDDALLARGHRRELGHRGDGDLLAQPGDAKLDAGEVALLTESQDDALRLDGLEAGQLDLDGVGAGLHRGKHEVAGFVGDRRALVAGQLVDERDRGAGEHGVARVDDRAAQLSGEGLRDCLGRAIARTKTGMRAAFRKRLKSRLGIHLRTCL